jgi:hypothetical protein
VDSTEQHYSGTFDNCLDVSFSNAILMLCTNATVINGLVHGGKGVCKFLNDKDPIVPQVTPMRSGATEMSLSVLMQSTSCRCPESMGRLLLMFGRALLCPLPY